MTPKLRLFGLLALFSLGLPRAINQSASSALFLKYHHASSLAAVYLAVAVLIPMCIWIFLRVERNTTRYALFSGIEVFRFAIAIVLPAGFWTGYAAELSAAAVVWVEIEFVMGSILFWGLAGQCFTIGETKRAFPLIASGEQIGVIAAAPVIGLVLLRLETTALYWVAAASLAASFGMIGLIVRATPALSQSASRQGGPAERPPPFNQSMRRYLALILASAFLANAAYFLVDNLFYRTAQEAFTNERDMANFFGVMFSAAGGITLAFTWLAAPRLMARFGASVLLAWLPAALAFFAIFLVAGSLSGLMGPATAFAVIATMKITDDGLRASIYRPAFQTLLQPLPEARRVHALAWTEGYAEPLGIAGAGVFIILANALGFGFGAIMMSGFAVFMAWFMFARVLRRAYLAALSLAASRRQNIEANSAALSGPEARRMILKKLQSGVPAEMLAAADLLRTADRDLFIKSAPGLLLIGDPLLAGRVLADLTPEETHGLFPLLKKRFMHEKDAALRRQLIHAMAASGDTGATPLLLAQARTAGPLQEAALAGLAGFDQGRATAEADRRLRDMARSEAAQARLSFLAAAGRAGVARFDSEITALFDDPDLDVRRLAALTAGRSGRDRFVAPLAHRLASGSSEAAEALAAIGPPAVADVAALLTKTSEPKIASAALRALGRIATPGAVAGIKTRLFDADPAIAHAAAKALWSAHGSLEAKEARKAVSHGKGLLKRAAAAWQAAADLEPLAGAALLQDALRHQSGQNAAHCLILAALARRMRGGANGAPLLTAHLRADQKAYLAEFVDSVLPPKLRPLCAALLADVEPATRLAKLRALVKLEAMPPQDRLIALAEGAVPQPTWVRAAARELLNKPTSPKGDAAMALSTVEKVLILKSADLFRAIPDESLAEFAPVMPSAYFDAGETVMSQGEAGDCLYIIVSGGLDILRDGKVVKTLGGHDIVGDLAALDPQPRTATVRAATDCHLLVLTNHHLETMINSHADISFGIIKVLCDRLRSAYR